MEPERAPIKAPRAGYGRLFVSWMLSLSLHAWLLYVAATWPIASPRSGEIGGPGAFSIALVEPSNEPSGFQGETVTAAAAPVPAPPVPSRRVLRPKRVVRAPPKPPRVRARPTVDGVRIATAADIRAKLERERNPPVAPPAPPPAEPTPRVEQPVASLPAPSSGTAAASAGQPNRDSTGTGPSGAGGTSTTAGIGWGETVTVIEMPPPTSLFRADSPGYQGRIFGQVSVRSSIARDNFYGRIHLFPESALYRDYSNRSLFGYDFRQELGEIATREFETGRVNTPGAYLVVTDLFPDGHYSTMAHTVLFAFPRTAPGGGNLYDVVEEPDGGFRLRGPAGSFLVFDGRNGALRRANRFVVEPQGDIGAPPRIGYRGLYLRLEAVGSNPFLQGRPATVVDAAGRECSLSTSDLFSYAGRQESDVFRFPTDNAFFGFLRTRCAGLDLPEAAASRVAQTEKKPKAKRSGESSGLFQLFGR